MACFNRSSFLSLPSHPGIRPGGVMTIFAAVLSLILGGIFLVSALPKLRHPKGFILTVLEYRILPPYLSKVYGTFIPLLEFALALFSLTGIMLRFVAIIMSLLIFSFIMAISVNIQRGRNLDCNCFGTLKKRPIGKALLIQDSLLLSSTIFISVTHTWMSIESWSLFHLVGIKNDAFGFIFAGCIGMIIGVVLFLRRLLPQKNTPFSSEELIARF
jgi:putative oxidoreductase